MNNQKSKKEIFNTDHLQDDLIGHTIRGGRVTFAAQALNFFINTVSIMILARLLTPGDFGIIAMVTTLTGIVGMLKDAGLSTATVQRDIVDHEQISTLFWINVGISLALAAVIASLAPVVAWFYGEDNITSITVAIAVVFLISGLTVQHLALLRRQMRFHTIAKIQIASSVVAMVVAVIAAKKGAGYWAIVMQMTTSEAISLLLYWRYCKWLPGKPKRGVGARSLLKFGGYLTGFNFANYFARNTDNILIGKVYGNVELGLYSRAYSLLLLPIQQISGPFAAVATPALSRLQNKPQEFKALYLKILNSIIFITFPLISVMIICSKEVIVMVLGEQWTGAAPIFLVLAVSAFIQPIGNISGLLYITLGRTKEMFSWGVKSSAFIILSFLIGLPYGALGVALCYSVAMILMSMPMIYYAIRDTPISAADYLAAMKYPVISVLISILVGSYVHGELQILKNNAITFAIAGLSIVLAYFLSLFIMARNELAEAIKFIIESSNKNRKIKEVL